MRDNPTIKAFIAALRADAELAMREFSTVSPLDAKTVAAQQVRVGAYELVKRMIETIITRGQIAEHDIRMQDQMSGLENDP